MTTPPIITLIRITLTAQTPFVVASPESTPDDVGLPVARDASGRPTVPPSSLAGALRAHLGKTASTLMGNEPGEENIRASRLWLLGTRVIPKSGDDDGADGAGVTRRWQTAVDRSRGAASTTMLRWTEMLPAGTTVTAYLRLDSPPDDRDSEVSLLRMLAGWAPRLGHGVSGGYGRLRTETLTFGRLDLSRIDDLTTWLTVGGPDLVDRVATEPYRVDTAEDAAWLELRWRLDDAVQIVEQAGERSGDDQAEGDGRSNILRLYRSGGSPTIPGTSWKGVFRSRAEFILRSIGVDACMNGRCATCPTCLLFGYGGAEPTGSSVGQRSAIGFRDSVIEDASVEFRPHVAIDRFTGGARDSALYTDEVAASGAVTLHVDALSADLSQARLPWARALMLAVARDLHDGLIGVGHSTTRGYGSLRLVDAAPVASPAARAEITAALRALLPSHPLQTNGPTQQEDS